MNEKEQNEEANEFDRKEYYAKKNSETLVCPFNPEHIVKKRKYAKHIKGCPNNPSRNPTFGKKYIIENINRPLITERIPKVIEIKRLLPFLSDEFMAKGIDESRKGSVFIRCECNKVTLTKFEEEDIKVLMERVKTIYNYVAIKYEDIIKPVSNNIDVGMKDDGLVEEKEITGILMPEGWEFQSQKHTKQCLSILKHLIDKDIVQTKGNKQTIIESGAGTAMLSAYYSVIPHEIDTTIYLVDRMTGLRKKYDRFSKRSGDQTIRIPADLGDVAGNELIEENEGKTPHECSTSVIGKHLCGSATDMALRLSASLAKSKRLRGIGIALCCHSKGDGHDDCAVDFFNSIGVRISEITLIHRMASWAIALNENGGEIKEERDAERIRIGEMCRSILNVARVVWLQAQENIKEAGLVKYCEKTNSLENVLLWAKAGYGH